MKTPVKAVFFNAPPRAGKDTACHAVEFHFLWAKPRHPHYVPYPAKFAEALKRGAHALFGLNDPNFEMFEQRKDVPTDEFFGHSAREVYIKLSEAFMKPLFGRDVFGRIFAQALVRNITRDFSKASSDSVALVLCADSGFKEEIEPILEIIGRENALIVQISREGCDFKNDSRSYIDIPGVTTITLHNTEIEKFKSDAINAVTAWLDQPAQEHHHVARNS